MRLSRNLLLFLTVMTLSACAAYPLGAARLASAENVLDNDDSVVSLRWRFAEQTRAVVVVTHGLNLNPDAMTDIETALHEADMDVVLVSLSGHENSVNDEVRLARFRQADFADWQDDVALAMEQAALRAREEQVPLHLVGFSMGGLLAADYVNSRPDAGVASLVLLAPALSLRWTSYLLMPLSVLPNFFLPSVAPDAYRANNYSPVSAYESLYQGLDSFTEQANSRHLNIPTLVMVDPRDELISPDGVESFITEFGLDNWRLQRVRKSEGAASVLSHLIISAHSLGEQGWETVRDSMLDFLGDTGGRQFDDGE